METSQNPTPGRKAIAILQKRKEELERLIIFTQGVAIAIDNLRVVEGVAAGHNLTVIRRSILDLETILPKVEEDGSKLINDEEKPIKHLNINSRQQKTTPDVEIALGTKNVKAQSGQAKLPSVLAQATTPVGSSQGTDEPKRKKRFEPQPNIRGVVQHILVMTKYPKSFEEVLEQTYGPQWKSRSHSSVLGGRPATVPYGEEIYRPDSQIRKQIRNAVTNVYRYLEGKIPEGYVETQVMIQFGQLAKSKTFKTVDKHLKEWGV